MNEVVTQLSISCVPLRATGTTWSTLAYSSQCATWLLDILVLGCSGKSSGMLAEITSSTGGKNRRSPL